MLKRSDLVKIRNIMMAASAEDMNQIADIFNEVRRAQTANAARSFAVGDKVKWTGKAGNMTGVIQKVNRKNIVVDAGSKGKWNVTATLLSKV